MKKNLFILGTCMTLLIGAAFALKQDQITFSRTFTLEKVDIEIESDGNLNNVMPDTAYTYKVAIQNTGEPCYVRIKDNEELIIPDTSWIKIGDYYYYPESLESNEKVLFTDSIYLDHFEQGHEDIEWTIHAEAIQSQNFELNLELEDPFLNQEILSFETGGEG